MGNKGKPAGEFIFFLRSKLSLLKALRAFFQEPSVLQF